MPLELHVVGFAPGIVGVDTGKVGALGGGRDIAPIHARGYVEPAFVGCNDTVLLAVARVLEVDEAAVEQAAVGGKSAQTRRRCDSLGVRGCAELGNKQRGARGAKNRAASRYCCRQRVLLGG